MDDQTNPIQPGTDATTGGAQPVGGDTTLPWMNFSADASASAGSAGGTTGDASAATTPAPAAGSFDPFGNPFASDATSADATAAAFAPSPADGSLTPAAPAPMSFTPSEPTAFTSEPETAPAPEAALWSPEPSTSPMGGNSSSSSSASHDDEDSLELLSSMKTKFDEEEEEFNRQIEEHNANIQFEKDAISKLRSERSERLAQMREVVRGLEDMLGIKKPENKPNQERRNEEPRKAERVAPKKSHEDNGINDFLAA